MKPAELAKNAGAAAATLSDALTARAAAVNALNAARADLAHAEAEAARPLSEAEQQAQAAGQPVRRVMEGSNEQQRKASLKEITADARRAEQAAEVTRLDADLAYDLAKLDWDLSRELIRVFTAPK